MTATLLSPLLLAGLFIPGPAADNDLAKLQGVWTTRAGPNKDIPVSIEIRGSVVTVRVAITKRRSIQAKGELVIDSAAAPKTLDWVKFTGRDDQEFPEILAIYELNGDILRICNGGPNNGRPCEFKAGEGALADVLTFKREKPAEKDNERVADDGPRQ
jgi:uncharacterized protein (TIGR03067 family)